MDRDAGLSVSVRNGIDEGGRVSLQVVDGHDSAALLDSWTQEMTLVNHHGAAGINFDTSLPSAMACAILPS